MSVSKERKILQISNVEVLSLDERQTALCQSTSSTHRRNYNRWSPMEEGVTLAWRDVNVYVHCKTLRRNGYKRIVNNVTGAVKAGSLVALMGASGSGKTTLMSTLAFRNSGSSVVEGDILVNGRLIGDYMRHLSGFMHQDDHFVGSLTVWEHLYIMVIIKYYPSSRLKLDRRTPKSVLNEKIEELLRNLGLTNCRNTRIGLNESQKVLSGGEKKRLSFATELLTDPQLLFCDEPTTGLDSYSAQKIVAMMNLMATSGKTIVCTIHQPSSEIFAMFSQLILLADGRIAYMGSTSNALKFFRALGYHCPTSFNPADFYIRTLALTPGSEDASKQTIRHICDHFVVSEYIKEVDIVVQYEFHMGRSMDTASVDFRSNFKKTFWWTKLYLLFYRSLLLYWRNTSLLAVRMLQKIAIALLIGICYFGTINNDQEGIQAIQGVIFIIVAENTFNPMYSVLAAFPEDRPLFLREYKSGLYSVGTYYFAKVAAMLPGLIIETFLFTLIAYWLAGLRPTNNGFWLTTLIVILTINIATSCGIFFSNAFDSVPTAMSFLVPFDFLLLITSGLFIKLSTLPNYLSWSKYLSWIMYSVESLTVIQWEDIHNITCENSNLDVPCLTEGSEVLENYSFSSNNLQRDLWSMFLIGIVFHILGFLCLYKRTKNS